MTDDTADDAAQTATTARRTDTSIPRWQRGDLLASFPFELVLGDVCVMHPLASSNETTTKKTDSTTATVADIRKQDKRGRTVMGACSCIPLPHETFGQPCLAAFAFLECVAKDATGSGAALHGERHAGHLHDVVSHSRGTGLGLCCSTGSSLVRLENATCVMLSILTDMLLPLVCHSASSAAMVLP